MQEQIKKVDSLINKQQYKAALIQLREFDSNLQEEITNPEDLSFEQMALQSLLYEKYSTIYQDLNLMTYAIVYLIKLIRVYKEMNQIKKSKEYVLKLCDAYGKMGKSCFHACYYEMNVKCLETALKLLTDHNLLESGSHAFILTQLGNYHRFMFEDDQAEGSLKKSLEIRINLFTERSVEAADSKFGLAQLYSDMGLIEEAMKNIDEAIFVWKDHFGQNHLKTAKALYLKGNLYLRMKSNQENLDSAQKYIQQSLDICTKLIGERFQDTADCYHSLGKIKAFDKSSNEFINYFNKSIQILIDIYGNQHAGVAILYNNLGRSYAERKEYDNAVICFEKAIIIYRQLCGDVHGNLAITLKNCGDCHKELGRYKQAKIDYQRSLEIYQKIKINEQAIVNIKELIQKLNQHFED